MIVKLTPERGTESDESYSLAVSVSYASFLMNYSPVYQVGPHLVVPTCEELVLYDKDHQRLPHGTLLDVVVTDAFLTFTFKPEWGTFSGFRPTPPGVRECKPVGGRVTYSGLEALAARRDLVSVPLHKNNWVFFHRAHMREFVLQAGKLNRISDEWSIKLPKSVFAFYAVPTNANGYQSWEQAKPGAMFYNQRCDVYFAESGPAANLRRFYVEAQDERERSKVKLR